MRTFFSKLSILLFLIFSVLGGGIFAGVFAQNTTQDSVDTGQNTTIDSPSPTLLEGDVRTCPEHEVVLLGPRKAKVDVEQSYTIESTIPGSEVVSITHEIWSGSNFLESFEKSSISYNFGQQGSYLIKSLVTTRTGCTYVSQETIDVYERIILYIGELSEEFRLIRDSLERPETLLYMITIENDALQTNATVVDRIVQNRSLVNNADAIILDSQSLGAVLGALPDVNRIAPLNIEDAKKFAVSNINNSAFRRLIATYSSLAGIQEINVVPQNTLGSLINALLLNKDVSELSFVKQFSTSAVNQSRWLFMSYLVDTLLLEGMPLQMVLILLLIPIIGLVITIFRHIIGFSTYGVFKALLVALAVYTIGLIPTLVLLGVGMLAVLFSNELVRKIYILSAAKQALVISLYAILLLFLFVLEQRYSIFGLEITQIANLYGIFLVIYMLIATRSFFKESGYLFKQKWWIRMFQYAVVVLTVIGILHWNWLHNLILGYPELIFAVILLLFIVGRYTGLQVTEYLRFGPLISYSMRDFEEEEEE